MQVLTFTPSYMYIYGNRELCGLVSVCAPPSEWRATEYESTWLSEKEAPRGEDCSQPQRGWAVSPTGVLFSL